MHGCMHASFRCQSYLRTNELITSSVTVNESPVPLQNTTDPGQQITDAFGPIKCKHAASGKTAEQFITKKVFSKKPYRFTIKKYSTVRNSKISDA